ncbi:hypothetical protein BX600DRAFT_163374 [Xylariales sp. PMI_506]|nr:hypothetical protein BX600DRAFT_163374 [Xylariales sp. PMI_506]
MARQTINGNFYDHVPTELTSTCHCYVPGHHCNRNRSSTHYILFKESQPLVHRCWPAFDAVVVRFVPWSVAYAMIDLYRTECRYRTNGPFNTQKSCEYYRYVAIILIWILVVFTWSFVVSHCVLIVMRLIQVSRRRSDGGAEVVNIRIVLGRLVFEVNLGILGSEDEPSTG